LLAGPEAQAAGSFQEGGARAAPLPKPNGYPDGPPITAVIVSRRAWITVLWQVYQGPRRAGCHRKRHRAGVVPLLDVGVPIFERMTTWPMRAWSQLRLAPRSSPPMPCTWWPA